MRRADEARLVGRGAAERGDTLVLAAVVIKQILGPDLAVAAVKLQLEQQKDAKVRQRLLKLQERIDKVERYMKW